MKPHARDVWQLQNSGRTFFYSTKNGPKFFVYRSEHPYEERILELTDDYRDADGKFILPELVAWDGVISQ